MIQLKQKGDFSRAIKYLTGLKEKKYRSILERYGKEGVIALSQNTPIDTGLTADSWDYRIETKPNGFSIYWTNSVMTGDTPLVILLQYGHATGYGGFVEGTDFINPSVKPIFLRLAESLRKEVESI